MITLNQGEATGITFNITPQDGSSLLGKRVSWTLARDLLRQANSTVLKKVGGLPGSTADIFIGSQLAGAIAGTVNIAAADTVNLGAGTYYGTLWIDDGAGVDRCVTPGGYDLVVLNADVPRT
jgi:hypothetical protein